MDVSSASQALVEELLKLPEGMDHGPLNIEYWHWTLGTNVEDRFRASPTLHPPYIYAALWPSF